MRDDAKAYELLGLLVCPSVRDDASPQSRLLEVCEERDHVREGSEVPKLGVVVCADAGSHDDRCAGIFPQWRAEPNEEFVEGPDPVINLAVLSRFPLRGTAHNNVQFLLGRRRLLVSRGFAEVQVRVAPRYSFTLINAHLKSKRPVPHADEATLRLAEAEALRKIVEQRLAASPNLNLIVVGDLNDAPDTRPVKAVIGRGKRKLVDLRPFERNGDKAPSTNRYLPRRVTWTTYYGRDDSFSRFDYLPFALVCSLRLLALA